MDDERGTADNSPMMKSEAKRGTVEQELEERSELYHKRVKMRDLQHSGGRSGNNKENVVADFAQQGLDWNATAGASRNVISGDKASSFKMPRKKESLVCRVKLRGRGLDLNVDDVSCSGNADPYTIGRVKPRDDFECASSVDPLEERAPLKAWSESKKNTSLAHSRGETLFPKPHSRKSKSERMNKKIELAKKEQADRFAKIAAPTGLLNGLNPGIINHVRNSKQVHSIIEALVKSKTHNDCPAGGKHGSQMESGERNDLESTYAEGADRFDGNHQEGTLNASSADRRISGHTASPNELALTGGNGNSFIVETRAFERSDYPLSSKTDCNDDTVALILPSETNIMSNDASTDLTSVTALSIKAANVASQWLELLNQDTKGRLAALRSSRKRVQEAIQTEFPCLISRELSCNPKDSSVVGQCDDATASAHCARWSAMFDQMDKTLTEEESQLVSWCKQIQEMQLQCERGLIKYNMPYGSPQLGALQNNRLEKDPESDLSVRAAAASIYSTCNFLSSTLNPPCCSSL